MTINRNNYEEYFLLYVDRELNGDEQKMVEEFVKLHPDLEKELSALQQTISLPPVMIFEGKGKLYREETERRILPAYWMRIAVALVIILTGGLFWLLMTRQSGKDTETSYSSKEIAVHREKNKPANLEGDTINTVVRNGIGKQKASRGDTNPAPKANSGNDRETHSAGDEYVAAEPHLPKKTYSPAASNSAGRQKANPPAQKQPIEQNPIVAGLTNQSTSQKPTPPHNANPVSNQNKSEESVANQNNDHIANPALPLTINHQSSIINDSSISHQPSTASTALPSTIHHPPSTILPSTNSSILIFSDQNKTVGGFFKKLLAKSPDNGITADNQKRKIKISVFQFNLSK